MIIGAGVVWHSCRRKLVKKVASFLLVQFVLRVIDKIKKGVFSGKTDR